MIGQLIDLSDRYRAEAGRCADADAYLAACVMMGSTVETMLFCTVAMSEHVLREAGNWPDDRKPPLEWELGRLIGIATRAGWFADRGIPGADLAAAIDALNYIRVCSVHPAAYIREGASVGEREFAACFGVLVAVDDALGSVINELPDPPRN